MLPSDTFGHRRHTDKVSYPSYSLSLGMKAKQRGTEWHRVFDEAYR